VAELLKVEVDMLKPNPWNTNFMREEDRKILKRMMEASGPEKTPPLIVRRKDGYYEIINGEQRWTVAKELGWKCLQILPPVEADDLRVKTLCLSYNLWRGRQNWFKLCDVLRQDMEAGVDIHMAYGKVLELEQIEMTLSLAKIVPEARKVLEPALIKYPEVTLPQLHLLSRFPERQQPDLALEFASKPPGIRALEAALPPFQGGEPYTEEEVKEPKEKKKTREAKNVLRSMVFDCECGKHYLVDFLKHNVAVLKSVQKGGEIYEYVPMRIHDVRVECPKCGTVNEYTVEGFPKEGKRVRCWRCELEAVLDVDAGKTEWFYDR